MADPPRKQKSTGVQQTPSDSQPSNEVLSSNDVRAPGLPADRSSRGDRFWRYLRLVPPFGLVEALAVLNVGELLVSQANEAQKERRDYVEKLEEADRDHVFKYILLITVSALEGYVAQTRIQAQQSFQLSRAVAIAGFLLLGTGIGFGVYFNLSDSDSLDAAYLATAAGALTEFISGVFFYLYNRTLQQVNRFHDRMVATQQVALSFLASDLVTDEAASNEAKAALAKDLMSKVAALRFDIGAQA